MKSVKIGHQEWSSENLNVDHFNNGDLVIQQAESANEDWLKCSRNWRRLLGVIMIMILIKATRMVSCIMPML